MAAKTPLELTSVGRVPPREGGLSSRVVPSVAEVLPGLYLIATIVRAKNRCLLELLQPTATSSDAVSRSSELTHSDVLQRRLSESLESSARQASAVNVPATLTSGFRVPRVIQLVAEDEGIIETVALVREPLGLAFSSALEGQEGSATRTSAGDGSSPTSIHHVHVHFFIGTSNGTVLVGNALRGTILAVVQFQYHHRFDDERRGDRLTTTSNSRTGECRDDPAAGCPTHEKGTAVNQSVVKFVVRQRSDALLWNPSLPFSQLSAGAGSIRGSGRSAKASDSPASPTADSRVVSVFVVHSGGKVVELSRAALDVFVRVSVNRLDGRRPHLILEWSPETSTTAFPVAGPASDFAAHVDYVSVLAPSPASYSTIESRTASTKSATAESTTFSIVDADIVREPSGAGASPLLSPLEAQRGFSDVLLVGGTSPLFSSFRLQLPPSRFSASNTVAAVKHMVTGVARSLWSKAIGTSKTVARPPHLKKVAALRTHALLQADAKCTALQVDPTQQWTALAIEGGGRIYVADVQSGIVATVLKGCRAAQFTWWWTELAGGRPALLLVVYLPLRRAVEVYTTRTWQRLAARHVPKGSVLLRCCGAPCEAMRSTSDSHGRDCSTAACDGNGTAPLFMDPAGNVFRVGIQWVLDNTQASLARLGSTQPASRSGGAGAACPASETCALSTSVLRGCKTPDDFLELALKLPLPCPRVQRLASAGGGCSVPGGDEVRSYLKELAVLCETVQRRFAPGYAEIAVIPIPSAVQDVLGGAVTAVPRGVTAAQCLHYVQLYASLVENYQRLSTCKDVAATLYFDPHQWTSPLVTPDLWKVTFCIAAHPAVAAFVKTMDAYVAAALAAHPAELHIYKKHVSTYLQQAMRGPPRASATAGPGSACPAARELLTTRAAPCLADPSSFIPLPAFLRCFYVGSIHPTFLRGAIESAEDADGSVSILGPLSDLVFGVWGVDSFLAQLPALRQVGCADSDIAHITVTWVARQAGRDLAALLSTTTVGCLAATLLSFPDDHFAAALARAPIPFVSVNGDLAARAAVDSVTGLLWCCAVRMALRQRTSSFAQSELLLRRVRQLLQLWHSLSKCSPPPTTPESTDADPRPSGSAASENAVALHLRLSGIDPSCLPTAEAAGRTCDSGGRKVTATSMVACSEGDVIEVYLQRNGITATLLDGFAVPRADADAVAARLFPLLSAFVSLLGEAGYASEPDAVVVPSLAWIDGHQWDVEGFRNAALRPIEQLWQQLSSTSAKDGTGAPLSSSTSAVYASCLILVTMSVLQHALRPLTSLDFFFWETDAVPDGNFFPVDGIPSGLVLSGSRTTRDYLNSVQRLSSLLEGMLLRVVAPLENAERALLIQQISLALAADDALLFPLVPKFLRVRLTIWMQVLAQTPRAPLRRTQRVRRLVELILFFSEVSSLTMGGVPLTQLQSYLSIPWRVLLGGPSRRVQLQLLPTVALTDRASLTACRASPAATASLTTRRADPVLSPYAAEEEDTHSAPLNARAAATVLRRFLAAGGVLHAKQRGATAIPAAGPTPCLGLIAEDTRRALASLAQCLGLHESFPDIADVVLMDYEIKHLFPVATVEQEMLLLSSKAAAPQVAASILQSFLVLILQCLSARRNGYGQRGDRVAYDATSKQLCSMAQAASVELRTWLKEREEEMTVAATPESRTKKGAAGGKESTLSALRGPYAVPAESVLADPGWVTSAEHHEMGRLVSSVLSTGKGSAANKNLFHLLFTLSQWACEGRLYLPSAAQRVAHELPLIVERWEKLI
ncbi:conserved hypothetical protein [Leishmania major strain Friedlin]|uniref:Rab3-GAP regulatory subunit N-terminal domain-containing protein n=1 Tax=Leishmania major TaxID=5664 RepID=Q4Q0I5_LEIMA|nr:conserved hypothetical protein [Leishmania major strain Friedlin]CAG9584130.1 Rab3_GTPase-activating_protein_regulatory_subunit_N-terminus_-_putative [Leishmania major strain Friedlin]CAJ09550.1 conserved hypothetical protein [Leishmania major strain Friedlin]|eukprot:XP_001687163.1 conserved hypothetical protein [Leishmania major strain Friedlin]